MVGDASVASAAVAAARADRKAAKAAKKYRAVKRKVLRDLLKTFESERENFNRVVQQYFRRTKDAYSEMQGGDKQIIDLIPFPPRNKFISADDLYKIPTIDYYNPVSQTKIMDTLRDIYDCNVRCVKNPSDAGSNKFVGKLEDYLSWH